MTKTSREEMWLQMLTGSYPRLYGMRRLWGMTLKDAGEPGSGDSIGITLWDGNKLLFSSEWNGAKTVESPLNGGNLVVHETS
jgi:hypothetical protein